MVVLAAAPTPPSSGGDNSHAGDSDADSDTNSHSHTNSDTNSKGFRPKPNHPIDHLVARAKEEYNAVLAKETHNLQDAAEVYRQRRGRQPPPNFDLWFAFARNHSALVIEDFFDRIYHDLAPFWGVPAKQIRTEAYTFVHQISIRNGKTTQRTDIPQRLWLDLWQNLTQTICDLVPGGVPDVDMALNVMDESRMVVPWEEIDGYMSKERASRKIVPEVDLKRTEFGSLAEMDRSIPAEERFEPEFHGLGPFWELAVVGCPIGSDARKAPIETDFSTPPPLTGDFPGGSYNGYVQNWTLAKSPCDNAALQGLHGSFIEPVSISTTKHLFPLFGGSKLPMNNEILIPPAAYWTDDPLYSGGGEHGQPWEEKKDVLIWRGAATGGRNREENWTRFQRHRLVSMLNSTAVQRAETGIEKPKNFALPPSNNPYDLAALPPTTNSKKAGGLAQSIKQWSYAVFASSTCYPYNGTPHCAYTEPYFTVEERMPMRDQYAYKYTPDTDGNSFSGRYRGFLGSTTLPIKATIYDEWHDLRLMPWVHFVPMDNTFSDLYGIMEYFLGNKEAGIAGHDGVAKEIALEGKTWTEKALRKEDMMVYVYRLLLEYARLCDDERESMGWRSSGENEKHHDDQKEDMRWRDNGERTDPGEDVSWSEPRLQDSGLDNDSTGFL